MYFHTLFHPHVFLKNTNIVTRTILPNGPNFYGFCFVGGVKCKRDRKKKKKRKKVNQWVSWKKEKEKKGHLGEKKKLYVHLGGFQKF